MSIEATALELLKCCLAHDPRSRVLGNIRAMDLTALAASIITSCPKCGAEPWVNIDCDLCDMCSSLLAEQEVT